MPEQVSSESKVLFPSSRIPRRYAAAGNFLRICSMLFRISFPDLGSSRAILPARYKMMAKRINWKERARWLENNQTMAAASLGRRVLRAARATRNEFCA
jgi:hypothetical protein